MPASAPICPLTKEPCMNEKCAWFAPGIQRCAMVATGMIVEKIHDLNVDIFQQAIEPLIKQSKEMAQIKETLK